MNNYYLYCIICLFIEGNGYFSKHRKSEAFKAINENQKVLMNLSILTNDM